MATAAFAKARGAAREVPRSLAPRPSMPRNRSGAARRLLLAFASLFVAFSAASAVAQGGG